MKIKIIALSFTEKAFYILWTLFSVGYFLLHETEMYYMYDTGKYLGVIVNLTIISLLLVLFLQNKFSKKTFISYALFLLVVTLIEFSIKNQIFLVYILFIMVAQFVDFEKFIRYDLKLKTVLFFLVIFLCLIGFLDNYTALSDSQMKQSLGFTHPNKFCCFAFTILMEWIYVRFEKIKLPEWILIAASCLIIKEIGASRTMFYVFVLVFGLFILAKMKQEIFYNRIVHFIFVIITPLMAFLSFATTYLYAQGNSHMLALDELMTHRLLFQARFLEKYDINLFGQNIELVGTRGANLLGSERAILDNAYIKCALMYGAVFFIMLCAMYSILMHQFLKRRRADLALFALFFVLYAFGESYVLSVLYNVTLLCFLGIEQMGLKQGTEKSKKRIKIRIKI